MRALILVSAILVLAACSNKDQGNNATDVDESLTAANIVSNDLTAIDAVTGDAANLAEAAEINDIGPALDDTDLNAAAPSKLRSSRPAATKAAEKPAAAPKPDTATTNSAD